jgi:hypothetical protein
MSRTVTFGALLVLLVGLMAAEEPLTNETIIKMVQSGVSTETIIKTIRAAESFHFGTLPGDLIQLQQAKVPDEIIRAIAARINWIGPSPVTVSHAPVAPLNQLPKNGELRNGYLAQTAKEAEESYLRKGGRELDFSGGGIVAGSSAAKSLGLASVTADTFLSRGNMIGAGVYSSGVQEMFVSGIYRYFVKTSDPKLFPFIGAVAGANVVHLSDSLTSHNYLGKGEIGLRYFAMRHIAVDVSYGLQYLHTQHAGFAESTSSAISFGFAHVF